MAIRLRKDVNGEWVALCAAETAPLEGDIYLDDGQHYALTLKYIEDWTESGLYKAGADKEPNRMAEGSSFANYMCKLETWAEAYDQEAVVMSPEEFEALYDDAFFEAMDLEKRRNMTMQTMEWPVSTVMKNATLTIKLTGLRQFRVRLWLAKCCMTAAAKIMGCRLEFQEPDLGESPASRKEKER